MAITKGNSYLQRLIGAAALDAAIYEDVEADDRATPQAFATVLLSSIAAGIGSREFGGATIGNIAFISMLAVLGWGAWALVTYSIGVRLFAQPQTRSNVGELLRTIGFASAPGCLRVLGVLPGVTIPVFVVTAVWMLAAMVVAVRQALDYDNTVRAIAVCIVGWVLAIGLAVLLSALFGTPLS
jgi:hypothetical protein